MAIDFVAGPLQAPLINQPDRALGITSNVTEPAVTINNTDPGNLAISNQSNLILTTDAGATFTAPVNFNNLVPAGSVSNGDTDTAFDSQGRLFWTNLVRPAAGRNVGITQINPTTGAQIGATNNPPNPANLSDDKQFLTADADPYGVSPFTDNLYVSFQRFGVTPGEWEVFASRSVNQGGAWSAPLQLSDFDGPNNIVDNGGDDEGFTWPSDVATAPNGDVYVAYHSQPDINDNELEGNAPTNPNGTSGQIFVLRSTDGGVTFPQKNRAFLPGEADITFNRQDAPAGNIPGAAFWTSGAAQPWVLPDPVRNGQVYVVTNDDPDNVHGVGDDADVVIARSLDNGLTWTRTTVPDGAAGTLQIFPNAAIDEFGNIVVTWYDNRRGLANANGHFLLDTFATYSTDGGVTWAPAFMVSDPSRPLDPDVGVVQRFPNSGNAYNPANANETSRIGEYFGLDVFGGTAYVVFNGNNASGAGATEAYLTTFSIDGSLVVTGDDTGAVVNDQFIIRAMAGNPTFVEVLVNGQRQYAGLQSALTGGITVNGLAGNDTLTVDHSNGFVDIDIHFNGGIQTATPGDSMRVTGNGTNHGNYLPSSITPGTGVVTVDGRTITFTGLEPVVVNGMFEFTFTTPNSNDVLTIDSPAAGQNRISGTSGNVAFEALTFFDINHFEIDTATNDAPLGNPNDTVTFTADLLASNLTSFTIRTGLGNDTVTLTPITARGVTVLTGDGNDTIAGGGGADRIEAGDGNDTIDGNAGADTVFGGEGSDRFTWDPGDGSDVFEGQGGLDVLIFNGGAGNDTFDIQGNGTRLRFFRQPGNILIDSANVEQVDVFGLAGSDTFNVNLVNSLFNDLSDTDVQVINLNLGPGDAVADQVAVNGRTVADDIAVTVTGGVVDVGGLAYDVRISGAATAGGDRLTVNGNEGDDSLKAANGVEGTILLTLDGGAGDDFVSADALLIGGPGDDTLVGGAGNDTLIGDGSSDILLGLNTTNGLVQFESSTPGAILSTIAVTGLQAGDTLVGIDVRPATSQVYGLAQNGTVGRLYIIDPVTGVATLASTLSVALNGTSFGVDFNPVPDRLRIVSDAEQNLRVNVDTGAAIVDGAINPGNPSIVGAAYTNSFGGATTTTLFTIDATADALNTQNPPNNGTQVLVGALGVNTTDVVGFDIAAGTNIANAVLNVAGVTSLFAINLLTGAATSLGAIGGGATLVGLTFLPGIGNDLLLGIAGDDLLSGGPGEDTFVGGPGNDTIHGGSGFDTILIQGTSGADVIDVNQTTPTTLVHTVNGNTQTDTLAVGTVEQARIEAGAGADVIRTTINDTLFNLPGQSLRMTVIGGPDASQDRLAVVDDGVADLTVQRKTQQDDTGTVTIGPGNTEPFNFVYEGVEVVQFVRPAGSRLVVFKHDPNESNDERFTATLLGANETVNVDPTIDPGFSPIFSLPGDEDWYRVEAEVTGTLDFQVFFEEIGTLASGRPGLPANGNLDIQVFDIDGTLIAGSGPNFGANDGAAELNVDGDTSAEDERVRIPAVQGQTYYLRVFGAGTNSLAINNYGITVINLAPPIPFDLELDDVVGASSVNNAAAPTTTTFTASTLPSATNAPFAGLNSTNGYYVGKFVNFIDGPAAGQRALITNYTVAATTATFTLGTALSVVPTTGNFVVESVDSGRSQFDNTTRDNSPTIFLRLDDGILLNDLPGNGTPDTPPDEVIPIPLSPDVNTAGYRIAIFDEGNTPPQTGTAVQTPVGFATPVPGQQGIYTFTFTTALTDGSHFISARVQMIDPAIPTKQTGFGGRSVSLEIVVDTGTPPLSFGLPSDATDGLDPASDSGVVGQTATFADRITNVTVPSFFGTAEANAVVRLFVDSNNSGAFDQADLLIGQTVAVPIDGTNQFPGGRWTVRSTVDLNDLARLTGPGLTKDGLRRIFVTAEDLSGNVNPGVGQTVQQLDIFLDTAGPQITNVFITGNAGYNLFGVKPGNAAQGPTPLVNSLTITIQDFPARVAGFLYNAIQTSANAPGQTPPSNIILPNPGIFNVRGDHNGIVSIASAVLTNTPPVGLNPATAFVTLTFAQPLPDDRFTLSIDDQGLIDPAGNILDGESNAVEPNGGPNFPTGDGQPGGDFVARFTVDSRPEIADYAASSVFVDINGNFVWDPTGKDNDFTNRDLIFTLGIAAAFQNVASPMGVHDGVFAGNFNSGAANASGYDKLAAYGADPLVSRFRWLIDVNHDGTVDPSTGDVISIQPAGFQINGLPVAGNFNANAADGDEIGLFDGLRWWRDTNADNVINGADAAPITSIITGTPIVGDFDGDGADDFGTWRDDVFYFDLANDGLGAGAVLTINFGFPGNAELPLAADMDQDGIDDIGLWTPRRSGTTPSEDAEWYFLISGFPAARPAGSVAALNHSFTPTPLGNDIFAQFGDEFALPVVGNFDPPVSVAGANALPTNALDVNGDKLVTALDVLLVVNELNAKGTHAVSASSAPSLSLDANRDGMVSPLDALVICNRINSQISQQGASASASSAPSGMAADAAAVETAPVDSTEVALGIVAGSTAPATPASVAAARSAQAADAVFAESLDESLDPVCILAADASLARQQSRGRTAGPAKPIDLWDAI